MRGAGHQLFSILCQGAIFSYLSSYLCSISTYIAKMKANRWFASFDEGRLINGMSCQPRATPALYPPTPYSPAVFSPNYPPTDVARAPRHLDEWAAHPTRNSLSDEENKLVKVHSSASDTCMGDLLVSTSVTKPSVSVLQGMMHALMTLALMTLQEATHKSLQDCYEHLKPASRKLIELETSVGFALECCSYTQYVHRDGVHALFTGEVARWPDFSAVEASHNGVCFGK